MFMACQPSRVAPGPRGEEGAPRPPAPVAAELSSEDEDLGPIAVTPAAPLPPVPTRVVLVTIDGVRADDVFDPARGRGSFSCLQERSKAAGVALGGGGASCGTVKASGPSYVSLPGYLEIFTGRRGDACTSNHCPRTSEPTLLDELRGHGQSPTSIASVSSWDRLDRAVSRSTDWSFVLEGADAAAPDPSDAALTKLLAAGKRAAGFPGTSPEYRPDVHTMKVARHVLEHQRPRFLHVGLGDADELAHRGDVEGYFGALKASDAFVCDIADELARQGTPGLVVVTSDHGRYSADMRHHGAGLAGSSRAFVAAFGNVIRPSDGCASRDVTLSDIAPTLRVHLGLPPDTSARAGQPIAELLPAR